MKEAGFVAQAKWAELSAYEPSLPMAVEEITREPVQRSR